MEAENPGAPRYWVRVRIGAAVLTMLVEAASSAEAARIPERDLHAGRTRIYATPDEAYGNQVTVAWGNVATLEVAPQIRRAAGQAAALLSPVRR